MSRADVIATLRKSGLRTGLSTPEGISWGLTGADRMFKSFGIPRRRITQVVAEQNSGKTTLAMTAAAQLHTDVDAGRVARGNILMIDMEKTFEPLHALTMGIDVDNEERFQYVDPNDGLHAIDVMEKLIDTSDFDLVILDSVTMMVPRAMIEKEPGKALPALQARQNSDMVRRLVGRLHATNTAMLIVNHLTGTMKTDPYGNPILKPGGGDALASQTSALMWLKRVKRPVGPDGKPAPSINDGVAHEVTLKVEKNKLGRQQYEFEGRIPFGQGFDPLFDLYHASSDSGLLIKKGGWIYYGPEGALGKWNGQNAFMSELAENVDLFQQLRAGVLDLARQEFEVEAEEYRRRRTAS